MGYQPLDMMKILCSLLLLFSCSYATDTQVKRKPKLFFVTSSTSTSVSTTTSLVSTTFTCFLFSKTDYTSCTGRRKKRAIINEESNLIDANTNKIKVSRVERNIKDPVDHVESGRDEESDDRSGRFAWYYMTTTVTSTSTSTSTSTTFTSTMSILIQSCTPADFTACG